MTATTAATTSPDQAAPVAEASPALGPVPHAMVALALLWWGSFLTHGAGGRNSWALTVACVPALAALVAVKPWRVLSVRALALAATVATAPVAVCIVDPPGWFGADQAASYPYSAVLFCTVLAYATTTNRRTGVIAAVLAAAVAQFAWSLIPWVGGGDPSTLLVGTFYWYNQYAAFLLGPAVLGAGLVALGNGNLRLVGAITAVLASAGVVLSTSRATIVLLAAGWLAAGVLAVLHRADGRERIRVLVRWVLSAAAALAFTAALPGPPLFAHRVSALAATTARNAHESVSQNGGYRVRFWRQAVDVFLHHPLRGGGFGSFGAQAGRLDPTHAHSALVHSGLLQPLSDGGLLLALPFLCACGLVLLGLLRRLLPGRWRVGDGLVPLVALAALAMVAHSAVDFDWTYPSLMAAAAILSGAALATPSVPIARASRASAGAIAILVLATVVLAVAAHGGGWRLTAPS